MELPPTNLAANHTAPANENLQQRLQERLAALPSPTDPSFLKALEQPQTPLEVLAWAVTHFAAKGQIPQTGRAIELLFGAALPRLIPIARDYLLAYSSVLVEREQQHDLAQEVLIKVLADLQAGKKPGFTYNFFSTVRWEFKSKAEDLARKEGFFIREKGDNEAVSKVEDTLAGEDEGTSETEAVPTVNKHRAQYKRVPTQWRVSLDAPTGPDEDSPTLADTLADPHTEEAEWPVELLEIYEALRARLDNEQIQILDLALAENLNTYQIGERLGHDSKWVERRRKVIRTVAEELWQLSAQELAALRPAPRKTTRPTGGSSSYAGK